MRILVSGLTVAAMALGMGVQGASAQDWAKANLAKSPRHGEFVTIKEASGRELQAWVVYPEVKGKAPVVVMIHEIFGQSDWAREMADELAGAGYIVVEPDLLSGFGPVPAPAKTQASAEYGCDPMDCAPGQKALPNMRADMLRGVQAQQQQLLAQMMAQRAAQQGQGGPKLLQANYSPGFEDDQQQAPMDHSHMQAPAGAGAAFVPASPGGTAAFPADQVTKAVSMLNADIVTGDLDAAADYGKKLPAANGKLFVAGFCWGGGKTFLFATHRKDLSGAMVFYGPPPPVDAMKNITAPVYGFYAGNDARITATIPDTETAMKAAGKTYEPKVYDGAGHGFMRAGEQPDANPENSAARQAGFRRLVDSLGGVR